MVDERRGLLLVAQGEYASLDALQKAAMGEGDESVQKWLGGAGLADNTRVVQRIRQANHRQNVVNRLWRVANLRRKRILSFVYRRQPG